MLTQTYTFNNDHPTPLIIIVDPPCCEYVLQPGDSLRLILTHDAHSADVPFTIRYEGDILNLDIDPNCQIDVDANGNQETVWGVNGIA